MEIIRLLTRFSNYRAFGRRGNGLLGLVFVVLACLGLAGCGSSGSSGPDMGNTTPSGRVHVGVIWSVTRVIPRATKSIAVEVVSGAYRSGTRILNYPDTTITFPQVPPGDIHVEARAYADTNGNGTLLASGSATERLAPAGEVSINLDLNSTIQSVRMEGPTTDAVGVGHTFNLVLTGKSSAGSVIPIDQSSVNWVSSDTEVVRIVDGVATCLSAGKADITGVDIESGKFVTTTVTVSNVAGTASVTIKNDLVPITVKVLVLSYNPVIPSTGRRVFASRPEYTDPLKLTNSFFREVYTASSGIVNYQLAEFRTLDYVPKYANGLQLAPQEYFDRMMAGTLPQGVGIDHDGMLLREGVADLVNSGKVDEVFVYYDGPGMFESWMLGPRSFWINGTAYTSFPTTKPFVSMGFTPFVKTGNMLHSLGHRSEDTLQRFYGNWNLRVPVTLFDRFSANFHDSPGVLAGVGTVHFPANASQDYETFSTREVESCANDFLTPYSGPPTRVTVSRKNWGDAIGGLEETTETQVEYERGYQRWRFRHFPKFTGRDTGGRLNNWWRYMYRFDDYYSEAASVTRAAGTAPHRPVCFLH